MSKTQIVEVIVAAVSAAVYLFVLRRRPGLHQWCNLAVERLTRRASVCILIAALLPLAMRLVLLPWFPPPHPAVQDEYGHLLVADTLMSGRLANPPHPLARHFESNYILHSPAYASEYPIGQGVILAVGRVLLGHPWAGVLLAVCAMSGAVVWMLLACLPRPWALLGGLLAATRFGGNPDWTDGYWGGAFCAFAGALFFGALIRLRSGPSIRLSVAAGLGWAICWIIRPFESLLLFAILWGTILWLVFRDAGLRQRWIAPISSLLLVLGLAGALTLLHNYRVTGSALTLPYRHSQRIYGVPQNMVFQDAAPQPANLTPQQTQMYLYHLSVKEKARKGPFSHMTFILERVAFFFFGAWYLIPLICVLFARDNLARFGIIILISAVLLSWLYPFFIVHYLAAYVCVIAFLIVRGLMALSSLPVPGRFLAEGAVAFLICGGLFTGCVNVAFIRWHNAKTISPLTREETEAGLSRLGRPVVAFIRYGPTHSIMREWVNNTADIDSSQIVWCRSGSPSDDLEVMRYYKSREYWLIDVEMYSARMSPYRPVVQPGGSIIPTAGPPARTFGDESLNPPRP